MKTVFQRVISVIMVVILVAGTMSTMAFAADSFGYDRYMDNSKESISYNTTALMDQADEFLKGINIKEDIVLEEGEDPLFTLDLTSVDNVLKTIDDFRFAITLVKLGLGDLKLLKLNEKVFEKGMTRAKSGDAKIIAELLKLASANSGLISKLIDGTLDLGAFESILKVEGEEDKSFAQAIFGDKGFSGLLKQLLVSLVYEEGTASYEDALELAIDDFDAFLFGDFMDTLVPIDGFEIKTDTTVNTFLSSIFNILVDEYLLDFLREVNVDLSTTALASLDGKLILENAEYNLTGISFDTTKTVSSQINDFFGKVFAQLVPAYTWTAGDYTKLSANVEGVLRYLAANAGITNANTISKDALITSVIKKIVTSIDMGSYTKYFENFASCNTVTALAKQLFINIGKTKGIYTSYTASQTYEHVLGDLIIELYQDDVIIADASGNTVEIGDGKTCWEVWNYILNFFFNDKNFDAFINKDGKLGKSTSVFNKIDVICDMFASDNSSAFASETLIKGLVDAVFTFDFTKLVTLSAKRLETFGGTTPVVKFLYTGMYDLTKNWVGISGKYLLPPYDANGPFQKAFSNEEIGKVIENLLTTLGGYEAATSTLFNPEKVSDGRADSFCSVLGLLLGPNTATPVISVPNVVYTGSSTTITPVVKTGNKTLVKGRDYTVGFSASGVGTATATITGMGAYSGEIAKPVNVVFGKLSGTTYTPYATSVTLKWNKLPGAQSYNVYLGSKLIKNVTTNYLSITGLKNGAKNDYTVEAVSGSVKSAKATIKAVTLPANVYGLKATATNNQIKLTWNAAAGASGYYVQQNKSGKWTGLATVATNAATISATANTSYQIRVVPYSTSNAGEKKNGTASSAITVKTAPNAPSSLAKKSVTSTSATISWKAVSGAAGYQVEIYNGGWKSVGTTKSTSITANNLKGNTSYKFRVRAYSSANAYSAYSSELTVKTGLAAPKGLTFKSATATSVTFTWSAVSGASGYQIYVDGGSKKYSTSSRSYTVKSLKSNKSYKIKVRARKGSTYGDFSTEIVTSTAPGKVTLSKVSAGKKSVTPSWKKISGVTGYEIQYATSSKFKSKKTVKIANANTVKNQIKKLKKGKKYYVRVRAYKVVGGKTLYGSFSSTKSAKAK